MDHPLAPTSIGSYFRPIDKLDKILSNHPSWKQIQATIRNGTEYHTMTIEDKIRITGLRHRLLKGKRKSALGERATMISTKLSNKYRKGWCIPILPNHVLGIPNLGISLIGLSYQASINKRGDIINKYRFNHDLSFPGIASETSINKKMDRNKFVETHYGHMHKQLLHSIVNMRADYPTTRILIRKEDFKTVY